MTRAFVMVAVLMAPAMAGCLDWVPPEFREPIDDFLGGLLPGPGVVYATEFNEDDWNHDGRFTARVVHDEPLAIGIKLIDASGQAIEQTSSADAAAFDDEQAAYVNEIDLEIDDGIWDLVLLVDGQTRKEWIGLRIDATPPQVVGLERVGKGTDGFYTIGTSYVADPDHIIQIFNPDGALVSMALPHQVGPLGDGLHAYTVLFADEAGNEVVRTVQVITGDAKALPEGEHSAGIVARYTNAVRVWDLSRAADYLSRSEAAAAYPEYLGDGFGITPDDSEVQAVVDEVVTDAMTSMDAAIALFEWLYDNLEYTEERLEEDDLLTPRQTFANGGGVCRDLAAAYVSLLRAADVPARLITGYLAGGVDGFHAWVEFYAGPLGNQGGWVPVDVSGIDGRWDEPTDQNNSDSLERGTSTLLQSFGVRLPNYLPLRSLPPVAETEGWATAISVSYSYPEGSAKPTFSYEKAIVEQADEEGFLCVNSDTLDRLAAHDQSSCQGGPYNFVIGGAAQPFILQSTQVIDYGVHVATASASTTAKISLAIPFKDEVAPVSVEHIVYVNHEDSPAFAPAKDGKRTVTLSY